MPGLRHRPQTRTNPRPVKTAKIRAHGRTESRRELKSVARCSKHPYATPPISRASKSDSSLPQRLLRP
eukprot:15430616-Alexandrium_andersonii.AAC.1